MKLLKKLIMSFLTSDDRKVSLSVDNQRGYYRNKLKSAMDLVVEKNIFPLQMVAYSSYCGS